MTALDYGNARLRVRSSRFLGVEDYRDLLGSSSIEGVLGKLANGPYGSAVEQALGRHQGLSGLDDSVRLRLSTELSDVVSFYDGDVESQLRLYEARWDIRNLRILLRSLSRGPVGDAGTPLLVSTEMLDTAALDELASQRDVRSAVDLISLWRVPSPAVGRHLRRALPRFSETRDVSVLEAALDAALVEMTVVATTGSQQDGPVVTRMRRDIDRINLMACLRTRSIDEREEAHLEWVPLDGGNVTESGWLAACAAADREAVLTTLDGRVPSSWRSALIAWRDRGDLAALESGLDDAEARAARAMFRRDPLGIETPLAYIMILEAEAMNLRLIGRAIVHGIPRDEALASLVGVP